MFASVAELKLRMVFDEPLFVQPDVGLNSLICRFDGLIVRVILLTNDVVFPPRVQFMSEFAVVSVGQVIVISFAAAVAGFNRV